MYYQIFFYCHIYEAVNLCFSCLEKYKQTNFAGNKFFQGIREKGNKRKKAKKRYIYSKHFKRKHFIINRYVLKIICTLTIIHKP